MPNLALAAGRICAECGYDLRAATSDRCPECGTEIDLRLQHRIPWENRRDAGYVRSFLHTALVSIFLPSQLARACAGPVQPKSAEWFRRIIVLLVGGLLSCGFLRLVQLQQDTKFLTRDPNLLQPMSDFQAQRWLIWDAGVSLWPTSVIAIILTLWLLTKPSIWFQVGVESDIQRRRAAALSNYSAAPLLLLIPAALMLGLIFRWRVPEKFPEIYEPQFQYFWCVMLPLLVYLPWNPIRFVAGMPFRSHGRTILSCVGLLLHWVISLAFGLWVVPMAIGLVYVMFDSVLF